MLTLPRIIERDAQPYVAIRRTVKMPFGEVVDATLPKLWQWIGGHHVEPVGPPFFKYNVISEYQFGSNRIRHSFCSICGIKPFGTVEVPDLGALVAVNVACLEGLTEDQLAAVPVRLEDGRDDAWSNAPREGSYL